MKSLTAFVLVLSRVVMGASLARAAVHGRSTPADGVQDETVKAKPAGTAIESIDLDAATRKVTVLGDQGLKRVFVVDEKVLVSLTDLQPAQKVFLSYRFDVDGKTEAVIRVTPASVLPTVRVESASVAQRRR